MELSQIDKNLAVNVGVTQTDIEWFDVLQPPFSLHGLIYDKSEGQFLRFPRAVSQSVSPRVDALNCNTSGGRVRFKTNSDYIAIHAVLNDANTMPHMCLIGQSGFDLYKTGAWHRTFTPPSDLKNEYVSERSLHGDMADYCIYFPLYRGVKHLYVALRKGATLSAPSDYKIKAPVVFYGSSITQGACAGRPGINYVNTLMRKIDADFVNLGFSGSCKGEIPMAEYIATLKMSAFVYDYDHNVRTPEQLESTHKPFFDIVRKAKPNLPIIMVSAPDAYFNGTPFYERRDIIYNNFLQAKQGGDNNVYFVDGSKMFPKECIDNCIIDGTHPSDLGYHFMAEAIGSVLVDISTSF